MALLSNITYSPGEPMQDAFDKINAAIDEINDVLGGGTTDQIVKKSDSVDFNTVMANSILPASGTANLKIKVVQIGDWNMDSTASVTVAHGLADFTKVRSITVMIRNDADGQYDLIDRSFDSTTGTVSGGCNVGSTNVTLYRIPAGPFDAALYDSTSFNRGFITIIYEG